MDIRVKIPLRSKMQKRFLDVDRDTFVSDLKSFVHQLENEFIFDEQLKTKLFEYGINQQEFDKMVDDIGVWADYDENHSEIGFPYENWIDRLLTIYE